MLRYIVHGVKEIICFNGTVIQHICRFIYRFISVLTSSLCHMNYHLPLHYAMQKILIMPPTLEKLEGHIAFGLFVCVCTYVRASVTLS